MPAKKIIAMFALAAQAQDAAPVVPGEGTQVEHNFNYFKLFKKILKINFKQIYIDT